MVSITIFLIGVVIGAAIGVGCMFLILGRSGRDWFFGVGLKAKDIVINWLDGGAHRVVLNMRGVPVFIGRIAAMDLSHSFFDSSLRIEVRQYGPQYPPGNPVVHRPETNPPDPHIFTPRIPRMSSEVELVPPGNVLPNDYTRTS